MERTPDLGQKMRVLYVSFGLVLIAGTFVTGQTGWLRVVLPLVGLASILGGATGI